jgi:hypothetical protein
VEGRIEEALNIYHENYINVGVGKIMNMKALK